MFHVEQEVSKATKKIMWDKEYLN